MVETKGGCINPDCYRKIVWRAGRPPSFCTDKCRKSVARAIEAMRDQLVTLMAEESTLKTARQRLTWESQRTLIGWKLQRYAGALLSTEEAANLALASS